MQIFGAEHRLRERRAFLRVERQGRRAAGRHFVVFLEARPAPARRLGVTVSRRVGRAVQRNRVKRLIREVFRREREELPASDMVVIARPGASELSYDLTRAELIPLWKRAAETRPHA